MSQHESAPARPLYDEVERIRLRNGWTKVQLAKRAGVGRNTIDNWRTQPRAPLAPTVKDVAERLGIDADLALRLAGIAEPEPSDRFHEAIAATNAMLDVIEKDPRLRKRLREIMSAGSGHPADVSTPDTEGDSGDEAAG
jgi:transcriptional regulator with XRE-family HTH domain